MGVVAIIVLYNIGLLLLSPIIALGLALRLLRGKSRAGWGERWGRLPAVAPAPGRRIWVHGASVGEVSAVTPILRALKAMRPDVDVVITCITPGGHETASKLAPDPVSAALYAPFDVPFVVRRFLRALRPDLLVVVETELWPNLLQQARNAGVPAMLVSGRISDRSFPRYLRARALTQAALTLFRRVLAQTEADADRLRALGAPAGIVAVGGNPKFDQRTPCLTDAEAAALRLELGLAADRPTLVVGSTRSTEEEEAVLDAFVTARAALPGLQLLHAPRHPDRADDLAALMRRAGLEPARRSARETAIDGVVILDTFGELARAYAVGDVAFIGNSLSLPGGGQNLLQPLAQGKAVLHGPRMQNFRDITALAAQAGVAFEVRTQRELADALLELLADPDRRARIARAAPALIEGNQGASEGYARAICEELR